MSRRKQANPKPLKVLDDEEGAQAEQGRGDCAELPRETNDQESYRRDSEDFDPFRPLMIDIDKQMSQSSEAPSPTLPLEATPPRAEASKDSLVMTSTDTNSNQDKSEPAGNAQETNLTSDSITNHDTSINQVEESPETQGQSHVTYTSSIDNHIMQSPPALPSGGHYDSTPNSRVASPASSVHSTPTSSNRGKGSAPNKARRKHDRILPVSSEGEERYVCPVCKILLSSATELTKHIRSHNQVTTASTTNSCTICGKILSSQSSLDRHMLVHSGERPFKCKICKMAFTTNGNMHRHMRIHEKELEGSSILKEMQSLTPRARGRRKNRDDPEFNSLGVETQFSDQEGVTAKRKLSLSSSDGNETPVKFRSLSADPAEHSPRQPSFVNYDSVVLEQFFRRCPETTKTPVAVKQEVDMKSAEDAELTCPVCAKTFLCKYGLETHLETHPNYGLHCPVCSQVFLSRQELDLHSKSVHRRRNSEISQHDSSDISSRDVMGNGDMSVGFHELDFCEFSTAKFPLVAKVWCEKNPRQTGSNFHNFTCRRCHRSFPCRTALNIHRNLHASQDGGRCSDCECDFSSVQTEKTHTLQHVGEKVVSKITNMEIDEEKLLDKTVSKQEYLAVLNLHVSKSSHEKLCNKEDETSEEVNPGVQDVQYEEKKMNNDYFFKLGQIGPRYRNNHIMPNEMHSKSSKLSGDLAGISQILKLASNLPGPSQALNNSFQSQNNHILRPIPRLLPITARNSGDVATSSAPQLSWSGGTMIRAAEHKSRSDAQMQLPTSVNHQVEGQSRPASSLNGEMSGKEMVQCEICNEVFNNYRTYKGHVRGHMGLSPYKCNQCQYSSADKSTLIRHMRTHNGERPYQCKVCEFAFTTKANCERHVRKKHGKEDKNDIEEAIGCNHFLPPDSNTEMDAFMSPDTVCKYCGVDFKFFRALKHHLRSHSSCQYKPFTCCLCRTGFSTKANCMRHIQKQHPEVDQSQIEDQISINENLAAVLERLEACPGSPVSDDSSSSSPSPAAGCNPLNIHPAFGLPQMPAVMSSMPHSGQAMNPPSVPRVPATPMAYSQMPVRFVVPPRGLVPLVRQPPKTYITSPPILNIKPEPAMNCYDEPLDFSMKPKKPAVPGVSMAKSAMNSHQELNKFPLIIPPDAPVDLTRSATKTGPSFDSNPADVSKSDSFSVSAPVHSASVVSQASLLPGSLQQPDYGMLRYKKEYQKFYNPRRGKLQCPYCSMLFKHGLKLQVHIRSHTNERPFHCEFCSAGFTIKTNLDRHLKTRHMQNGEVSTDTGSKDGFPEEDDKPETNNNDISMETNNFSKHYISNFLSQRTKSPSGTQGYDSGCELAPVKRMLDTSNLGTFTAFLKTPEMEHHRKLNQFHMNHSSMDEGLMAKKRRLELDHVAQCSPAEMDLNDNRSSDTISPTGSIDKTSPDGDAKNKKRNSYADSPHKLVCPYCPRAFPWISSLNRHILTHTGQKPFKCPRCPVMFSTKSNRERHLIRKHGLNVLDPSTRQMMDRPYKCHLCVFSSFSTSSNLKKHYAEKHPESSIPDSVHLLPYGVDEMYQDNMSCISEISDSKNSYNYEQEEDEDEDPLEDGLGDKLFLNQQSSTSRVATPTPQTSTTPTPRVPTPTPRSTTPYSTPPGTPEKHINPERDNYNVDKITECWKCSESFPSRKALLRHLKDHNIDLPFKCYLCDASFDSRLECLEHKTSHHTADWELLREKNKVENIEEFANIVNSIVEHNFLRGDGNVDSGVVAKLNLGDDLKPESDYQQRKVYCTLCPKRFWSLQDLRRHMRSHTGERPFECDICQKRFTLKHSMMRHKRKHLGAGLGTPDISDDEGSVADETGDFMRLPVMRPATRCSPLAFPSEHLGHKSVYQPSSLMEPTEGDTNDQSDLLHNLLGVEGTTIDKMLESSDVDSARRLLGVKH